MRSNYEKLVAEFLQRNKVRFEYEPYTIKYFHNIRGAMCAGCYGMVVLKERRYLPDFVLENGIIIETKGNFTPSNRTSMLSLLATSVGATRKNFRLLFMRDNTFGKKDQRYSDWCKKHKIIYHVSPSGEVPKQWMK